MKNLALNEVNVQELNTNEMLTIEGGGVGDILNGTGKVVRRLGLTVDSAVKEMYEGISELIKIEKELP